MNFLEKKLSIFEIKGIHNDVSFFEDFINSVIKAKEFNLLAYSNLGRSFSAFLANYNLPQIYRKFVTEYNKTIKNEFSQDNQLINQILISIGFVGVFYQDSFYLKDLTDLFSNNKFKKESNFEQSFYSSLIGWSDEWSVKRQQHVGSGICDLTIEYANEKVAIELKKGVALSKDVLQASGYYRKDSGFDSILIAQKIDNDALKLAEEMNISCYEYCLGWPISSDVPEFFFLEKVNNIVSKTKIHDEFKEIESCGGHTIKFFEKNDYIKEFNDSVQQNKKLINTLIGILENQYEIPSQK